MEKKRDIKVFIEQLTKPRVEALFSELFDEYANKGIDKKQFAVKLLTGELEGIMDDYVDAFMGKTALTITDMDTNQLNSKVISKVKLTYFSVEDLSYFISDIVEAMESVSEEYSKLFAVLTAIGYNYQNKGFILPNLLYVDDITLQKQGALMQVWSMILSVQEYSIRTLKAMLYIFTSRTESLAELKFTAQAEKAIP